MTDTNFTLSGFENMLETLRGIELFHNVYFQFTLLLIGISLVAMIVQNFIRKRHIERIKNEKIKTLLNEKIPRDFFFIGILLGVLIEINYLDLAEKTVEILKKLMITGIIAYILVSLRSLIQNMFNQLETPKKVLKNPALKNKNFIQIFRRFIQISLFLIVITLILGVWGIQIGPILTGLGIAGIAIGLAIQDPLSNVFGGLSLILDNCYNEGDYIQLESGTYGVVFQIGYRSTKIRTFNDEIVILPNSKLAAGNIKNLSRPNDEFRLSLEITVGRESDPDLVKQLILDVLNADEKTVKLPVPTVFLIGIEKYALKFKFYVNIESPMIQFFMTDRYYRGILKAFKENGVTIPYPIKQIKLISGPEVPAV